MRLILWLAFSISLAPGVLTADRAIGAAATSSKVWIGHYAEYEAFLRTAVIDRTTSTGRVFFKPGGLAAGGALHQDGYRAEIAGYKLDRLLNLDMVPPTVEVRHDGNLMSLKLWILNARPLKRLDDPNALAPNQAKWTAQLQRAYAFEDLAGNLDEHEASPLVDPQGNLILLDHSLAFTGTLAQPYEIGKRLNQVDRSFLDAMKALDKAMVQRAIGDLVDAGAIDALLARRDMIVKALAIIGTAAK